MQASNRIPGRPAAPATAQPDIAQYPPHRRRQTKVDRLEDLLPEHMNYRDDGCDVSPTCLSCPLPACRYEVPGGLAALKRRPRDAQLLAAHRDGTGVDRLCSQFGLSRRSVFRIIAAARNGTRA